MKFTKHKKSLMCFASGLTTALCFTVTEIWFLCFFTLIPFFYVLMKYELSSKQTVRYTYCYGMPFFAMSLLWFYVLVDALNKFMAPILSYITMTLAIILVALILSSILALLMFLFSKIKRSNICDVFSLSALYMLSEWGASLLGDLAFPWARLSNITAWAPCFIQGASLFGSLFVSLIVLFISALLAYSLVNFKQKKSYFAAIVSVAIFAVNTVVGLIYIGTVPENPERPIDILMIQANLAGQDKWDAQIFDIFTEHLRLSNENITDETDIVVWPETAIPTEAFDIEHMRNTLVDFTVEHNVTLVTGAFDTKDGKRYNAMFVVTPDGKVSEPYYKQLLVPFGEFTPFQEQLASVAFWVTNNPTLLQSMGRGDEPRVYDTPYGKLNSIICYESILGSISTEHSALGSELTLLLSNDSWFGTSAALKQHLSHAVMRAVENNRYIARAGNCGITALISPTGEITASVPIYEVQVLHGEVGFVSERTLYSYVGDIIVLPAAGYCLYLLATTVIAKVREKRKSE